VGTVRVLAPPARPETAFERDIIDPTRRYDQGFLLRRDVGRAALPLLDSAMARLAGRRFMNIAHIFDHDTATVFVDAVGHTTEEANAPIVAALMPPVMAALAMAPAQHRH